MSRSRKKTMISGIACAKSEKYDKKLWHRAFRRRARTMIASGRCDSIPHFRAVSDPWSMAKDGKRYFGRFLKDPPKHDWCKVQPLYKLMMK